MTKKYAFLNNPRIKFTQGVDMKTAFPHPKWLFTAVILLASSASAVETILVTTENFAQAETAWNFTNWAKKGSDKKLIHLRDVAPTGSGAPTVRMNWDTLYSVRIVKVADDKTFTVHLPDSDLYMSAHILDSDGFAPYYIVEKGKDHEVKVNTDYALIIFRTEILDRMSEESLKITHASQDKIKVTGMMDAGYVAPNFDQEQMEKLRKEYKQEFLDSGITLTYAAKAGEVDQHILNLSHAAGWGGMPKVLGVTNVYQSSETMSGDVPHVITFEDPGNKFFTSFTLYDADGYLMEGETHINDKMWKPNEDGTITIHFNAGKDAMNNLASGGKPFNYIVRSYGISQKVMDDTWKPVKPEPLK
jgi:hypothetical protein